MSGPIHEKAETMLGYIKVLNERTAWLEARAEEEMKRVRERYEAPLAEAREKQKQAERDLVSLMKKNKPILFDGTDQVDLKTGILLYGEEDKIRIPRDALEKIKEAGWEEAIKVAESVDRGVVEKWPLERLVVIGAERKRIETYSYELKDRS